MTRSKLVEAIMDGEGISIRITAGTIGLPEEYVMWTVDVDGQKFGAYRLRSTAYRVACQAKAAAIKRLVS